MRKPRKAFVSGVETTIEGAIEILKNNSEKLSSWHRTGGVAPRITKVRFSTNYCGDEFEIGTISDYNLIFGN